MQVTTEDVKKYLKALKQTQRRERYSGMKHRPKNIAKRKVDKGYKIKKTVESVIWYRPGKPYVRKDKVVRTRIYLV